MNNITPNEESVSMTFVEKGNYLRDHDCSADGVEPFILKEWDDSKTPEQNLDNFHQWWNSGVVNDYL